MKLTISLLTTLVYAAVPAFAFAVPVSVTVVDPDGQPLPEARVSWIETKSLYDDPAMMTEQSGANGFFVWDWDGEFPDRLPSGETPFLRVRVAAPGMAAQIQTLYSARTKIRLEHGRIWSGVVLDQNQQPIQGATVKVQNFIPSLSHSKMSDVMRGAVIDPENKISITDAVGRWRFGGMSAVGRPRVTISAPRFVSQRLSLEMEAGDATPISLNLGGWIMGVLRAPDGLPAANERARVDWSNMARTDATGRFTLGGVEAGNANLFISDFYPHEPESKITPKFLFGRARQVEVEAEKTTDVGEIKAEKGVLLTARIVDARTRAPIEGARYIDDWNNETGAVSDKNGQLQIRVLTTRLGNHSRQPTVKFKGYVEQEIFSTRPTVIADFIELGIIALTPDTTF